MTGISLICFAASYGVALLLELSRFVFRSGVRGAVMIAFATAGLIAHSLFLIQRANLSGAPLSSPFDWYLVAAWSMAALYIYVSIHHFQANTGAFVLPVVLSLMAAAMSASRDPFPEATASGAWRLLHSGLLLLALITVLVGFLAGIMYLLQSWRLKQGISAEQGIKLPSLEWLDRVNSRSLHISTWLIGGGFFSGLILNLFKARAVGNILAWNDPAMLGLGSMFLWMLASTIFSAIYKPARHGRKVAYLSIACFVFLVLAIGTSWVSGTKHPALGPASSTTTTEEVAP